jgi:hypothetical protein
MTSLLDERIDQDQSGDWKYGRLVVEKLGKCSVSPGFPIIQISKTRWAITRIRRVAHPSRAFREGWEPQLLGQWNQSRPHAR